MTTAYLVVLNGVPYRLHRYEEDAIAYMEMLQSCADNVVYLKQMVVH